MEYQTDQYRHDLPPPPPAHQYHPQATQPQDYAYEQQQQQQQRRPSHNQQYYQQQQSSSSSHDYASPTQDYPTSPLSSQPQAPQQQQQHQQPPPTRHSQKSRTFSFHSDRSHKRTSSKPEEVHETAAEKEARRLHSKADPTLAISEAEPAVEAAMTQSSLAPLRSLQHRDTFGNPIADPDKSNPTRSRWERPLDTIRSFEAAIDGAYHRKSIVSQADTDPVANWNRRNSYHPGGPQRFRPDSFHGSRPVSFRPENTQFSLGRPPTSRNSVYDNRGYHDDYNGGGYGPAPPRHRPNRVQTDPYYNQHPAHNQNVYHLSHKDRSYETVTSAEGSGNSDQIGYQTDPTSSDNSSIERRSPPKRQEPVNDYGIGFAQNQAYNNLNLNGYDPYQQQQGPPPPPHGQPQQNGPPAVPRKQINGGSVLRRQPPQQVQQQQQQRPAAPEKRKSWFARRFSKNN